MDKRKIKILFPTEAFEALAYQLIQASKTIKAMYEQPTKSFDELADAWNEAVAEAATRLPDVASYPYDKIQIPLHPFQLDPMSIYRWKETTPNHINVQDTYVTFRKEYVEGVAIGWEKV